MLKLIEPYNPGWKTEFKSISGVISMKLTGINIDIEHVGSTAVPGLCAKPILDIDIIVLHVSQLSEIEQRLITLGYYPKGEQGVKGRFSFGRVDDHVPFADRSKKFQAHHLYVCMADSLALKNHITFRDALRKDPGLVKKYAGLKKELTEDKEMTRETYSVQKTGFIISVLKTCGMNDAELEDILNANR
ncbi:GrpB family protein [Sediminibacterium roseum]|uniref:GrpB family protein n=1 Tax=Sediminibacterium roseum TaxID=1978412 RepID=A0ABW9ZQV3_9BACT|nr:GrpB family protein [Sediminibacterium roseum]NCI49480.1 GrpB family protein [Sediminibacterium roseum]